MEIVDESVQVFWGQVTDGLRDRISSQDWCSWFSGARAIELGPEHLVVEVVNEFAARWVEDRFRPLLESAVAQAAGIPLTVRVVARAAAPADGIADGADAHSQSPVAAEPAPLAPAAAPSQPPIFGDIAAAAASTDLSRSGTVMTESELRAELAGGVALPSQSLGALADSTAAPQFATPTSGASIASAFAESGGPTVTAEDAAAAGVQPLNDRYRFDTFVIGPSNQMVHAAALSVAETPSKAYNPLFIHGSTGLGKTHLLHAIGHYVRETRPGATVAYVTTEQFLTRFIHAIQAGKGGGTSGAARLKDRLKAYFRGVDVLLMDDVQFLAGKGTWLQEELFHIFNALHETGRQIVLTSDCAPDRIPQLEERLRSRFAWGLIADIDTPEPETRVAILRKKAQGDGISVPTEVFELIAERITTSVRELEGVLTRVVAAASLSGRDVTLELAQHVLQAYAPGDSEPISIDRIQNVVCEHFTIAREDMLSERRTQNLVLPRQIAMYLSRVLIGAPSTQVARKFNRKDHSTILHAENKIDEMMRKDQGVHDLVAQLTTAVRGSSDRSVVISR